jgi:hypothetical protein
MEMSALLTAMAQMMFGKNIVRAVSIIDRPAARFSNPLVNTP